MVDQLMYPPTVTAWSRDWGKMYYRDSELIIRVRMVVG